MSAVGYILGRTYNDFRYVEHSKYSLPIVKSGSAVYSGFNMGAGENALFEIFSTIYSAGKGTLLVLDEVELGLHAEAQRKFIERLKDVCLEMNTQVICTTHSNEIFDCLPGDARFFIESVNGKTRVTQGISSDFAFSKLSSINGMEADILVEDEVAKMLILASLPANTRSRITFNVIGSASALARQLAAIYVRGDLKPVIAIYDGDQLARDADNLGHAKAMAERVKSDFDQWYNEHIAYLPGDTWPELWIIQKSREALPVLASVLNADKDELADIIDYGLQAGKHNEFSEISKHLGLEKVQCLQYFTSVVAANFPNDLLPISKKIEQVLGDAG